MKKCKIAIGILIGIGILIFVFTLASKRKIQPDSVSLSMSTESSEMISDLQSLVELKKQYGSQITDKGAYRIVTAFYKENPRVILENEEGELLELAITSVQETDEEITFSIDELEPSDKRKKLVRLSK